MEIFKSQYPNVFDMMRLRYLDSQDDTELYSLSADDWKNPIEDAENDYHHFGTNFTDIQWEFVDGRIESVEVRKYLNQAIEDESAITTIAVCLSDTQDATRTALYLPDKVLRKAHQVLVYQKESDAIIRNVNNPDDTCTKFDRVLPFGNYNDSYSTEKIRESEGEWVNAYYSGECSEADKQAWSRKDFRWVQEKWNECSVSDKWSSIHCANMIHTKLRSIGCTVHDDMETLRSAVNSNMDALARTEHNRWVTEHLLAGWRPFDKEEWESYLAFPADEREGHNKNKDRKSHANICSNDILQQVEPESPRKDRQVTLALLEIVELRRNKQ